MESLARACLSHRWRVVAVLLVGLLLSGAQLTRARLDGDLVSLFNDESGSGGAYDAWRELFEASERVFVAVPHPAPTSPAAIEQLRRAEDELRKVDGVVGTISLASAPRVADEGGLLKIERWGEALIGASDARRAALELELFSDKDLSGALIAPGGGALAIVVEIDEGFQSRPPGVQLDLTESLRDAVAASGLSPKEEVRAVGFPVVVSAMLEISVRHITTLIPVTALLLILVVLALYRRVWPAVFAVAISGLSVTFASAVAVFLDERITPLHSIAPVLIVVIALADTIFVLNAYLRALEDGYEKRAAIVRAIGEVGPACLLTSISTFLSFASFLLIPARAMQLLGIVAGTGVAAALLLIITLGPVLLDLLPTPRPANTQKGRAYTQLVVDATRHIAVGWPRTVIGVALAMLVGTAFVLPGLEVETDWARRMYQDHPMPRAERWVKERFGGFTSVDVVWRDAAASGKALTPEMIAAQHAFANAARTRDEVITELSTATALMRFKRALGATDDAPPGTDAEIAQLRELMSADGSDPLRVFVAADGSALRTILRVRPTGIRALAALSRDLEALAAQHAPPGVHVEVTGLSVMLGRWLDTLLAAQVRGLGLVALMSVLILGFGLRSARAGVFALLPNSLPVLLFLATLTLPGEHFDSDYLLVCIVALGIVVDDTIHFLSRFRSARLEGQSPDDALDEAYRSAGPAMVQTTLILTIGLSPLLLSDYLSARMFFTELSKVLAGALFADLMLLPAMIRLGWIRFDARKAASP